MPSIPIQRRRGISALIYKSKLITDSRGNQVRVVDEANPYSVKLWASPQRSSRAELTGQQDIDIERFGTSADLSGVDSWSQVDFRGSRWDVVMPPAYHHGTRHTRHWSIDCRKRPDG